MRVETGEKIGHYVVKGRLGRGSMGTVYRAEHEYTRRTVALKVLSAEVADSEMGTERFRREVSVSARVGHPGIVEVFDAGEFAETFYYAMELLEGRELADEMEELALAEGLHYLVDAARTLSACHEVGVVHRDLKPANIFLPEGSRPTKILDFGVASIRNAAQETRTGFTLGTPFYMSPEQARDARTVSPASDVWSLGVILYEMLTGRLPFDGESPMNVMMSVVQDAPRPLPEELDVPAELRRILGRTLQKETDERIADAGAFADALEGAAGQLEPGRIESWVEDGGSSTEEPVVLDDAESAPSESRREEAESETLDALQPARFGDRSTWGSVALLAALGGLGLAGYVISAGGDSEQVNSKRGGASSEQTPASVDVGSDRTAEEGGEAESGLALRAARRRIAPAFESARAASEALRRRRERSRPEDSPPTEEGAEGGRVGSRASQDAGRAPRTGSERPVASGEVEETEEGGRPKAGERESEEGGAPRGGEGAKPSARHDAGTERSAENGPPGRAAVDSADADSSAATPSGLAGGAADAGIDLKRDATDDSGARESSERRERASQPATGPSNPAERSDSPESSQPNEEPTREKKEKGDEASDRPDFFQF